MKLFAFVAVALVAASAEIFYKETFDETYTDRWVVSDWKKAAGEAGEWKLTAGEFYGDAEADKGIQTSQDARFYTISSKADKPFTNKDKTLVLQFQIRFPQKIDCGGGYIKLMPKVDQSKFNGDSPYYIMFGPDICGSGTRRVHTIFNYKGENKLIKKEVTAETDQTSHVYTLIVNPDNTYEIQIDGEKKQSGSLTEDWDFLPPMKIKDPSVSKPSDWVEEPMMDDPEDVKPEGYDDIQEEIVDPEAEKPEDWDDESDGEWEAPLIDNPEYKGEWKAKQISNPDYKGPWVHPEIDNPEYEADPTIYAFDDFEMVGIEIWQVKAGTIFDNIIVTDSLEEAAAFRAETFDANIAGEKAMFEEAQKLKTQKEEEERKKLEEERKKMEEEDDEDDDDDDDDDDDEPDEKDEL